MDCEGCTLCCKLLELHEIPSGIEELCIHCLPGKGCGIHGDSMPKECQQYQCMWSQMEKAGEALRPDKCGVIFDRAAKDVITARLESGRKLDELLLNQLERFLQEGFSVLMFRGRDMKFFLNEKHTEEYVLEVVRDRSKLH